MAEKYNASNLSIDQILNFIKNLFVNMLKNGPLNTEIIQGFEMLIYVELNSTQEKLDFVYKCLQEIYQILGIINNKKTKDE